MKIAVCDDNREYLNIMSGEIREIYGSNAELDVFLKGEDLISATNQKNSYDIIFLDMEMDGISGIETANIIRKSDEQVIIIFVTSYSKYMQESFRCAPFRFLVKPVASKDIGTVLKEAEDKLKKMQIYFSVTENKTKMRIRYSDVLYIESHNHWVYIHTVNETVKIRQTIKEIKEALGMSTFMQVHKSYIINYNHVKRVGDKEVELYGCDVKIPVSRSYKKIFAEECERIFERKYGV